MTDRTADPPCKGGALPAELITHFNFLLHGGDYISSWWVMTARTADLSSREVLSQLSLITPLCGVAL